MHHNHDGKGNNSMMWMIIPCLLIFGVLLFGGGELASSGYIWLILIGICVVPHVWMMFKGHGEHGDDNTENKIDDTLTKQSETKDNDKHKRGGCCH